MKMSIRIVGIGVPLFVFAFGVNCIAQKKELNKVKEISIHKMGFGIETHARVSCASFYKAAPWFMYDTFYIRRQDSISTILDYFKKSFLDSTFSPVDVRAKVFLKYCTGKVDTLCMGIHEDFMWNSRAQILFNKRMIEFLKGLPAYNEKKFSEEDGGW